MKATITPLLIKEPPLQVLPSLANAIGLNQAIVLQQTHYHLQRSSIQHKGTPWLVASYEASWQCWFPFWSKRTIQRVLDPLKESGLIRMLTPDNHRAPWYTIDYQQIVFLGDSYTGPVSPLLINEPPLQLLPSLAVLIGLDEAIILQQMHYWLQRSRHQRDGRTWVYNTYLDWHGQFPFWSLRTLKRHFQRLSEIGLIVRSNYNRSAQDRTLWYSIDYEQLQLMHAGGQSDLMEGGQPGTMEEEEGGHIGTLSNATSDSQGSESKGYLEDGQNGTMPEINNLQKGSQLDTMQSANLSLEGGQIDPMQSANMSNKDGQVGTLFKQEIKNTQEISETTTTTEGNLAKSGTSETCSSGGNGMDHESKTGRLPSWLDPQDWDDFRHHRAYLGSPLTPISEARLLQKLKAWHGAGYDVVRIIEQAIIRNCLDLQLVGETQTSTVSITPTPAGQDAQEESSPVSMVPDIGNLIYPRQLVSQDRKAVEGIIKNSSLIGKPDLLQTLLDELAGAMDGGHIRRSPQSYLRALVKRAQEGEFVAELAVQVAEQRRLRQLAEAAVRKAEAAVPVLIAPVASGSHALDPDGKDKDEGTSTSKSSNSTEAYRSALKQALNKRS